MKEWGEIKNETTYRPSSLFAVATFRVGPDHKCHRLYTGQKKVPSLSSDLAGKETVATKEAQGEVYCLTSMSGTAPQTTLAGLRSPLQPGCSGFLHA